MKKIISLFSAFALIAILLPTADAAGVNATAIVTGDGTSGTTIEVTSAGNFDGDDISSATITTLAGGANATTFTYADDATANTSTITVDTSALSNNNSYILKFTTTGGDFGIVQIAVGTPTNNTVTVNATVEPTLTFGVTKTQDFGTLVAGTKSDAIVSAVTATNATGGLIVNMTATGLATSNTGKYIGNLVRAGGATATTPADDLYQVKSAAAGGGTVIAASTDVLASQAVLTADNITKANTTTTVTLEATARATTEAGAYSDTLTFTATASF